MIEEKDVEHIAMLAQIGITKEELSEFTGQFNEILDFFNILDQVEDTGAFEHERVNVFREDEIEPSLTQDEALANTRNAEDGFFRAPRVM
jgi:aspartyl-tRNA(Asn)/glutamyl-tRNA(Gln) amidotransferase subunit C